MILIKKKKKKSLELICTYLSSVSMDPGSKKPFKVSRELVAENENLHLWISAERYHC